MDALDQKILLYASLNADDRAEVDAYVGEHPEAAEALAAVQALDRLLGAARPPEGTPTEADLAEYLAARHAGGPTEGSADAERLGWVEEAIHEDPATERAYREMARRLDALVDRAEDPFAQFERLAGQPVVARPGRLTRPALRLATVTRFAVAAAALLAVAYGALVAVSIATVPEQAEVAALEDVPPSYGGLTLRGTSADLGALADRFDGALRRVHEARRAPLGLFPHYDDAVLDGAAEELAAVIEALPVDAYLALKAGFVLGQVRLHQGRLDEAREALEPVVTHGGPDAAEARRMLDWLLER